MGGAITAAKFLEEFVEGKPWVHLDIAGTAWLDEGKPYFAKGPFGRARSHFRQPGDELGKIEKISDTFIKDFAALWIRHPELAAAVHEADGLIFDLIRRAGARRCPT